MRLAGALGSILPISGSSASNDERITRREEEAVVLGVGLVGEELVALDFVMCWKMKAQSGEAAVKVPIF
jgi:hypothetical protein